MKIGQVTYRPRPDRREKKIDINSPPLLNSYKNLETLTLYNKSDNPIIIDKYFNKLSNFDGYLYISHYPITEPEIDTFRVSTNIDTLQLLYHPRFLNYLSSQRYFNWPLVSSFIVTSVSSLWYIDTKSKMDNYWKKFNETSDADQYLENLRQYERYQTKNHIAKVISITSGTVLVLTAIRNIWFRKPKYYKICNQQAKRFQMEPAFTYNEIGVQIKF